MAINKVWIEDGCTSCGLCEETCPDVFVMDDVAEIKDGAKISENEDGIIEAAESCPVEVIQFD